MIFYRKKNANKQKKKKKKNEKRNARIVVDPIYQKTLEYVSMFNLGYKGKEVQENEMITKKSMQKIFSLFDSEWLTILQFMQFNIVTFTYETLSLRKRKINYLTKTSKERTENCFSFSSNLQNSTKLKRNNVDSMIKSITLIEELDRKMNTATITKTKKKKDCPHNK